MNERIKELKEQAILLAHDTFSKEHNNFWPIAMEKFAELIVRECIDVFQKDLPGEDQVVTHNEVIIRACNVAEHFGVEE